MKKTYFTLLELVIVTIILALLAGGVVMSASSLYSDSNKTLAQARASTVYKALIKFKKDMGSYPRQNSLALSQLENPAPIGLIGDADTWFNNENNFNQLFELPVNSSATSATSTWKRNIDSKRGWDGPYINNGLYTSDDSTLTSSVNSGVISRDRILAYKSGRFSYFFRLVEDTSTTPSTFYLIYELDGVDQEIQLP